MKPPGIRDMVQFWTFPPVLYARNRVRPRSHALRAIPQDPAAVMGRHYRSAKLGWNEPDFDPEHPEGCSKYLTEHGKWMMHLYAGQFGAAPKLSKPHASRAE